MEHGRVTTDYIQKECKNVNVVEVGPSEPITPKELEEQRAQYEKYYNNMSGVEDGLFGNILKDLKQGYVNDRQLGYSKYFYDIAKQVKKGRKVEAVTTQRSFPVDLNRLAGYAGVQNIDPSQIQDIHDNVDKHKKAIREWIRKKAGTGFLGQINEEMEAMEALIKLGVPVYISGGNMFPGYINILSFADGVKTVGALDENGEKTFYSANNSLVKNWYRGDYPITELPDGYDYTEDGIEDVFKSEVTGHRTDEEEVTPYEIRGASVATPAFTGLTLHNQGLCGN